MEQQTEPLTQEEISRFNDTLAALGPEKRHEKDEALAAFKAGGDAWIIYARNFIK